MDIDLLKLFNILDFPYDTYDVLPERYKKRIDADDYNKHNQSSKSIIINFVENGFLSKQPNSLGPWYSTIHKIREGQIDLYKACFMANVKIHNASYANVRFNNAIMPFVKQDNIYILPDCTKSNPLCNIALYVPTIIETDGDSITYDCLIFPNSDIITNFEKILYKNSPVITYRCPDQNCAAIFNSDAVIKYNYNNKFIYTRCTEFIQYLSVFLNKRISNKYLVLEIVNNGVKPKWLTDYKIFNLL